MTAPTPEAEKTKSSAVAFWLGSQLAEVVGPLMLGVLVGGLTFPLAPDDTRGFLIIASQFVAIGRLRPPDPGPDPTTLIRPSPAKKLTVLAVVTALAAFGIAIGVPPSALMTGSVLFMMSRAASSRRANVIGVALALVALFAMPFLHEPHRLVTSGSSFTLEHAWRDLYRVGLVLLLVIGARRDQQQIDEARRRADDAEAKAARAADDERARIARDLHDVVAHHVSVMTLQAEAARTALPAGAAAGDEALERVADSGRAAMAELRRLLGILRASGADDGGIAPQPGIAQVRDLVEELTRAGMRVRLTVTGGCDHVPAGVGLSAYRVVQEALTNARKHAPTASVQVDVSCTDTTVDVRIVDDGSSRANGSSQGTGHGLIGMKERVALVGGTFTAEARTDGHGWRVEAVLPIGDGA